MIDITVAMASILAPKDEKELVSCSVIYVDLQDMAEADRSSRNIMAWQPSCARQ
jgi:hypothetical protein